MTAHQGHATKLTKQALNDGYDHVASVGGDGTHHEVLNGFFDGYLPINPTASMSIIPHGTGSDLARTLNLNTPFEGIDLMTNGQFQKVDIGRASFTHFNGTPGVQYFLNVADFGIGGMVVERVQRESTVPVFAHLDPQGLHPGRGYGHPHGVVHEGIRGPTPTYQHVQV